jgi:hypothetical protein
MELTEFTAGAGGNSLRQFVGKSENYLDKITFLNACWKEFYLHEEFEKPNHEVIYKSFAKRFDNYNEEGSPMEIESGYCFADEKEYGSYRVYVLDEKDLKRKE